MEVSPVTAGPPFARNEQERAVLGRPGPSHPLQGFRQGEIEGLTAVATIIAAQRHRR
jgi:hypothetical protein